ncbi:MAG: hypothetical protein GEU97_24310 [Actinophytocola sp.]|nr:hypothetical protein [Actinophytocola sp.]
MADEPIFACTLDEAGKAEREILDRPIARKLVGRERDGRRLILRFRAEPVVEEFLDAFNDEFAPERG